MISLVYLRSIIFYLSHVPGGINLSRLCFNKQYLPQKLKERERVFGCRYIDQTAEIHKINQDALFGWMIGAGNSKLDKYFLHYKIFRVHAVFFDAYGYMRRVYSFGPGYVYALTGDKTFKNGMLLAHVSGEGYWTCMKSFNEQVFIELPF